MMKPLCRLGYTEREAAFLELVAGVGGHYTRSQFNDFIERECGALAQRFIDRSNRLGHVRSATGLGNRVFYHLNVQAIYAAVGDPESRNRREHQPSTIRRRLMALDFCLLNKNANWLLTERDKLEHFARLGLDEGCFPCTMFGRKAKRYFADRQPISIAADGHLQFAFIDAGLSTFSHWELFLRTHRELFRQLENPEVIYCSWDSSRFRKAENHFRKLIAGQTKSGAVDLNRLYRHFSTRKLFEEHRFEVFDQARLDQLREDRNVFAGAAAEKQYSLWLVEGNSALIGVTSVIPAFRTQVLPSLYEWLSPIPIPERRAHHGPYRIAAEENSRGRHGQARQINS